MLHLAMPSQLADYNHFFSIFCKTRHCKGMRRFGDTATSIFGDKSFEIYRGKYIPRNQELCSVDELVQILKLLAAKMAI
jgi:hypothetical protein